jgi:hypothetical protein
LLKNWIDNNILELKKICDRVAKHNDTDDLFQESIEQILNNSKIRSIPDNEKFYFFAKIVRNNFNSKTSRFHKIYRKNKFVELNFDIVEDDYDEPFLNIEWVINEVEKIKQKDWYLGQIFLLWLSKGANLTLLSKQTGIPINNLSRDITRVKKMLHKIYNNKIANGL